MMLVYAVVLLLLALLQMSDLLNSDFCHLVGILPTGTPFVSCRGKKCLRAALQSLQHSKRTFFKISESYIKIYLCCGRGFSGGSFVSETQVFDLMF